jgi:hypothetical protein
MNRLPQLNINHITIFKVLHHHHHHHLFFFFLANISAILYEAMVAALALLIGLEILFGAIVKCVSNPRLCFYVFRCWIFTYVVFMHGHEMSFNIICLANSYSGTAY